MFYFYTACINQKCNQGLKSGTSFVWNELKLLEGSLARETLNSLDNEEKIEVLEFSKLILRDVILPIFIYFLSVKSTNKEK